MYGVLGQSVDYQDQYDASLLHAIPRASSRAAFGKDTQKVCQGEDIWNAYELSWLNMQGIPQVAIGQFSIPATSINIVESKSFKLYLNSFNQTKFASWDDVQSIMAQDLSAVAGEKIKVVLQPLTSEENHSLHALPGLCIDNQPLTLSEYSVSRENIRTHGVVVEETLYSHLLRSNCPMTNQPDWGSVLIHYSGQSIDHKGLLAYILGYRLHQGFHEHCLEQMFIDILHQAKPKSLYIKAFYTRRGGLDINPYRFLGAIDSQMIGSNFRLTRQ